jgi:hypothetical protein
MDITNTKNLRLIQYALHTILSNWDDDCEDDLASESITEDDVEKLANWIDNKIEESIM